MVVDFILALRKEMAAAHLSSVAAAALYKMATSDAKRAQYAALRDGADARIEELDRELAIASSLL